MSDYITHHHDWRKACEIAKNYSEHPNDKDYWQHQIDTLDNLKKERERLGTPIEAIEFSISHDDGYYFLRDWLEGSLTEWPEYKEWLNNASRS